MSEGYRDLYEKPVEWLVTEGYSDVAMGVLREIHPAAEIYRVTDASRYFFSYVFLMTAEGALDIGGFTTVEALIEKYGDEECCLAEPTTPEAVAAYFFDNGREDLEIRIVRERMQEHMRDHAGKFERKAWPPPQ